MSNAKTRKRGVTRFIPAGRARAQFSRILRRIRRHGERYIVNNHGEPQAFIASYEDYARWFGAPPKALVGIRTEAVARGLDKLTLSDINREIKLTRRDRKRDR